MDNFFSLFGQKVTHILFSSTTALVFIVIDLE